MSEGRQAIPVAGLLATVAVAGYMVTQLHAQQPVSNDFTKAVTAEVYDAQGQILLRGKFSVVDEDDDDIERKATLDPVGADGDATGEAEVEFARTGATHQEVEFSIRNVAPGSVVNVVIDGQVIGQLTADRRGRAELERDIPMPAAATP